jgi:hypothetical protein
LILLSVNRHGRSEGRAALNIHICQPAMGPAAQISGLAVLTKAM